MLIISFVGVILGMFLCLTIFAFFVFPVTWNDLVTNPFWIFVCLVIGFIAAVMVVDELAN